MPVITPPYVPLFTTGVPSIGAGGQGTIGFNTTGNYAGYVKNGGTWHPFPIGGNVTGDFSATGNITAGGNISGGNVTTTGNITGGNLTLTGNATVTRLIASGNVSGGNLSASGNISGGNLSLTGNASITGTATITTAIAGSITAGHHIAPSTGDFSFTGQGGIFSTGDGVLELLNNAGTSFVRLQLGGTTSLFPSIRRSGAQLAFELADGSANAQVTLGTLNSGSINAGSSANIGFSGRGRIQSPADSQLLMRNAAATDFSLLQFGGTTNAFPALKKSGATIVTRLADDSADADHVAARVISTNVVRLKGYTVAGLPVGTQGDLAFVTDALAPTYGNTLVGGGAVVTKAFHNGSAWIAG